MGRGMNRVPLEKNGAFVDSSITFYGRERIAYKQDRLM